MFRPICQHFVPSANILSRLQTSATRWLIWRLFVHPRRFDAGHIAHSYNILPILQFYFFAFYQVFSPNCKLLFLRWRMATREFFKQHCERFGGSKSKVINRQKGEQIVKALAEGHQYRHFRYFIKSKGFSSLTCEQVDLENVLCVPVLDQEKVLWQPF